MQPPWDFPWVFVKEANSMGVCQPSPGSALWHLKTCRFRWGWILLGLKPIYVDLLPWNEQPAREFASNKNRPKAKRKWNHLKQPSIFRVELAVSFRDGINIKPVPRTMSPEQFDEKRVANFLTKDLKTSHRISKNDGTKLQRKELKGRWKHK